MIDPTFLFVCAVFVLAGFVKGTIGMGLPTISMGLLAIAMPPIEAAALLTIPSFVTNVWQMLAGPTLPRAVRRLWPMMLGVCLGTWAGIGLMSGASARYGTALLGVALAVYALSGLAGLRLRQPGRREPILSPVIGAITGIITAATGVFVIPAVPYLQAVCPDKEELVQALGLSFTVSTLALSVNIAAAGAFRFDMAGATLTALALSCVGMWLGQSLRHRMSAATFRQWFFIGLLALAVYLVARAFA